MSDALKSDNTSDQSKSKDKDIPTKIKDQLFIEQQNVNTIARSSQRFFCLLVKEDGSKEDVTTKAVWKITNDSADATMSGEGFFKATSPGQSTIQVSYNGLSKSLVVSVRKAKLAKVNLNISANSMVVGQSILVTAEGVFEDDSKQDISADVEWSSSNQSIISSTYDDAFAALKLSAVGVGRAIIRAQIGDIFAESSVSTTEAPITSLSITTLTNESTLSLQKSLVQQLKATAHLADGRSIDVTSSANWLSYETTVATVDDTIPLRGLVTAKALGSSAISAEFNGQSANFNLIVIAPALTQITIAQNSSTLNIGAMKAFVAMATYADNSNVDITRVATWISSSNDIVSIENNSLDSGLARAVAEGSVTIFAILDGVASNPADITVVNPNPTLSPMPSPSIEPNSSPTAAPTMTPVPTAVPTTIPAPTPSQTPIPPPTAAPGPTDDPTTPQTPAPTPTKAPAITPAPTAVPTTIPAPTPTATEDQAPSQTPIPAPTEAPTMTPVPTPVPTASPVVNFNLQVKMSAGSNDLVPGIITTDPSGLVCNNNDCSGSFSSGKLVAIKAEPSPGFLFLEWNGNNPCAGSGMNYCFINIYQDYTLNAVFTQLAYPTATPTPIPTATPSPVPTATPIAQLNTPESLKATTVSASQIKVTWTDNNVSPNEDKFLLEWSAKNSVSSGTLASGQIHIDMNNTSYTHVSLLGNTTYSYRITAVSQTTRSSAPSSWVSATTLMVQLNAPIVYPPVWTAQGQYIVWTDTNSNPNNESAYIIYRSSADAPSTYTLIGSVDQDMTSYTDTTAIRGIYYYYRLQAINGNMISSPMSKVPVDP